MKGKYKVLGFVGVSLLLVALLLVAMVSTGGQDFPVEEVERNLRHPQGEIIELTGPLSLEECERFQEYVQEHKDAFWFVDNTQLLVGLFVQEFVYASDLIDDVLYRDIHQDGTARIGVTSRDVIEEFKELGIPITFEIIDLDEVRHLEEAAQEIAEKSYVMGARYDYSAGRIRVSLSKQNSDLYETIYQEYSDFPLLFRLVDLQPETDHEGGEAIKVCRWWWWGCDLCGTSGFLANWNAQDVMVTAGHLPDCDHLNYNKVYNENNKRVGTFQLKKTQDPCDAVPTIPGDDAGFYTAYSGVTFNNIIAGTLEIDGWAEDDPAVNDWVFYHSGFRGSIWCLVTDVEDNYFEYWRDDGGPGDSGSPVFTVTGGILIHGVHTHGLGQGNGSTGFATNIDRVQELLGVRDPNALEDFEWGDDGDSLDTSGGDITWTVLDYGSSVVEIDEEEHWGGSRSGHWYRAGKYDGLGAFFSCPALRYISYYLRTDGGIAASTRHGDGSHIMEFRVTKDGSIEYEYAPSDYADTGYDITLNQWHLIEAINIDWEEGTYDIYADGDAVQISTPMRVGSVCNGYVVFDVCSVVGTGNVWIDNINIEE